MMKEITLQRSKLFVKSLISIPDTEMILDHIEVILLFMYVKKYL